jgi:hypothetical protein
MELEEGEQARAGTCGEDSSGTEERKESKPLTIPYAECGYPALS